MRYVIVNGEKKPCRAKDPDHCRYHKGLTHYKTSAEAEQAITEGTRSNGNTLSKTKTGTSSTPYDKLRTADDDEIIWTSDENLYDYYDIVSSTRKQVGVDKTILRHNGENTFYDYTFDEDEVKKLIIGHKITKADDKSLTLDDGNVLTLIDTNGSSDGAWFEGAVKDIDLNDNIITDVKTHEVMGAEEINYDLNILTRSKKIAGINIKGNPGNGYYLSSIDMRISIPSPVIMVCGRKVTEVDNLDMDNKITASRNELSEYVYGIEEKDPSTGSAIEFNTYNTKHDTDDEICRNAEFLIEPDDEGRPVIKNVETILNTGERVKNQSMIDLVNKIKKSSDKTSLDEDARGNGVMDTLMKMRKAMNEDPSLPSRTQFNLIGTYSSKTK